MRNATLVWMALLSSHFIFAQEFTIRKIERTLNEVVLHYDLIDTTRYRTYTIRVYSSVDNFLAPLVQVTGDVGLEVTPGVNKRIAWNAKQELGATFSGAVELDVRGRVYVPFIRLVGFEDVRDLRRTKSRIIKWTGGSPQNILNIQLYSNEDKLVHTFPNVPNELQYHLTIPGSVKTGKGYYLRIAEARNADLIVLSSRFAVKPKYPMMLKVAAVAVVAGVAYFLLGNQGTGDNELEGPPTVPSTPN
jgi:hypothetical protein